MKDRLSTLRLPCFTVALPRFGLRGPRLGPHLLVALALVLLATPLLAQGLPTGKIVGRVVSSDGQALPGVRVTLQSANLQGTRQVYSAANGEFVAQALPPGTYEVVFELEGFQTVQQRVNVPAAQTVELAPRMRLADVVDEIIVTGEVVETISQTSTSATTFDQELLEELPLGRTVAQAALLSPGVHSTGPSDNVTISGAMSYENLWLINGVTVNENLRGQPFDLFIEDAVQETTTSTAGVSAEYGRFSGGVITAITKSGGNRFSGSLRSSFTNDDWVSRTPLSQERVDDLVPTLEATFGGPILRDRLWFFTAGRDFDQDTSQQTDLTNIPFVTTNEQQRLEGKLTVSLTQSHSLQGSLIDVDQQLQDRIVFTPLDLDNLDDASFPQRLTSANYTGILGRNFFLEAQYSERDFTFEGSGGTNPDLIEGTPITDTVSAGGRYWHAQNFCGICPDEERNNENYLAKGSYFLSTGSAGSHDLVFGYDSFNDIRIADNHQSATDFTVWVSQPLIRGDQVFPQLFTQGGFVIYWPIFQSSQGTDFTTNSLFVNDVWRLGDKWTFNVGLRWDENDGTDSGGGQVADDAKLSPRLAVNYDVKGNGDLILRASAGRYVAAIANNQADSATSAGSPNIFVWLYGGPHINPDPDAANLLDNTQALEMIFDWFESIGGTGDLNSPFLVQKTIGGISPVILDTLRSPSSDELTLGFSKRLGSRGSVRTDWVHREFSDFYALRTDLSVGPIPDGFGGQVDFQEVFNEDSVLEREYDGLHTQFRIRLTDNLDLGGNWTWSHARGNFNGENVGSGPLRSSFFAYPEYTERSWNLPRGDLAIDQRNKARLWALYNLFRTRRHGLNVSLLQNYFSGLPYSAAATINTQPFVSDPGYVTPPSSVTYFFSGRGEFTTDDITRTDLSVNYNLNLGRFELFLQPEVVNLFDEEGVVAVDTSILTAATDNTLQSFNPFTTEPIEGMHWRKGEDFGQPTDENDFQQPRTFRFSVGLRF